MGLPMKSSLVKKILFPACLMTFSAAVLAALAFSAYQGQQSRQHAQWALDQALESQEQTLGATHAVLSEHVAGAMKILLAETRMAGTPTEGRPVAIGAEMLPDLLLGGKGQANRFEIVDTVAARLGGTATLFSRRGDNFLRISTNVKKDDGSRAIGTKLDTAGQAIQVLRRGEAFYGLVDILGSPFLTGYEPLKDAAGRTVGAAYVGYKISTLAQLAKVIDKTRILEGGFEALIDGKGQVLFGPGHLSKEALTEVIKGGSLGGKPWIVQRRTFAAWGFTMVAAYPEADVTGPLWMIRFTTLGLGLLGTLIVAVVFHGLIRHRLLLPVQTVLEGIRRKDLTFQISNLSDDEIGELGRAYNESNGEFRRIFQGLANDSERVASGSTELSATADEMHTTSEEIAQVGVRQRDGMHSVAAAMDVLSNLIGQVDQGVAESRKRTEATVATSRQGAASGEAASRAMEAIQGATGRMTKAISVIQDIARQTNLLSLNAAIEAAKAGAMGKGFAVVAEEVRKLAERSAQSTREIQALIEEVDTVVLQGSDAVSTSVGALEGIRTDIASLATSVDAIATAMEAQLRTRDEVRQHVQATNLDIERSVSASTEMAATVAEVARTAADLASVAESLARQVARYKI